MPSVAQLTQTQNNEAPDANTPVMKEVEMRLIEARCRRLYCSPDPKERARASAALRHLLVVRTQNAKARPKSAPMMRSSEIAVRLNAHRAHSRFAEVDIDGDLRLDFEEFFSLLPRRVRDGHGMDTVREWFRAADSDCNGSLSINEFFVWSIAEGHKHSAGAHSPLYEAFARFDASQRSSQYAGSLDYIEFENLCTSVGFGPHTYEIFHSLDEGRLGYIVYKDIEAVVLRRSEDGSLSARAKEMLSTLLLAGAEAELSAEAATEIERQTAGADWCIRARDAPGVKRELQALLSGSGHHVVDIMAMFNQDREQLIDDMEFQHTMRTVFKCHAPPWILDDVFASLDCDGNEAIGFDELFEFVRGRRHAHDRRSLSVRKLVLEPPSGAPWSLADLEWDVETIRGLLRQMLDRAGARASDLVCAWDRDGDGLLSAEEFVSHMREIACGSASLEPLWHSEVCAVAEAAFCHIASSNEADELVNQRELENWLGPAMMARPRLKPRSQRSEAAKHLGLSGPQAGGGVGGGGAARRLQASASTPAFRKVLSKSTRSMLLRSQQAHDKAAEQRKGAAKWEQWERRRREVDSSKYFCRGAASQLDLFSPAPSWTPPPQPTVVARPAPGRQARVASATPSRLPLTQAEASTPARLARLTRQEAISGQLQAVVLPAKGLNTAKSYVARNRMSMATQGPVTVPTSQEQFVSRMQNLRGVRGLATCF